MKITDCKYYFIIVNLLFKNKWHTNYFYRLKSQDFENTSKAIVQLFPTEHEATYYLKAQNNRNPAGKLRDAYHNMRTNLQSAGLLLKRAYMKKNTTIAKSNSS